MNEKDSEAIRQRLVELESEHRDLDDIIADMLARGSFDQLQMQRLKRRKLRLKDEIAELEDRLTPDIIA